MSQSFQTYIFPRLKELLEVESEEQVAVEPPTPPEVEEAIRRGYEEGLANGRAAAEQEAIQVMETARQQGWLAGRAEGLAEAERAVSTLRELHRQLQQEAKSASLQIEDFSVKLALAVAGKLIEVDSVRAEFVGRLVEIALKALAPERALLVRVNPADVEVLGDKLAGLPVESDPALAPGHARVEAGNLFVAGGIDQAFEQLAAAVRTTYERRLTPGRSE